MQGNSGQFILFGSSGAVYTSLISPWSEPGNAMLWGSSGVAYNASLDPSTTIGNDITWGSAYTTQIVYGGTPLVFDSGIASFPLYLSMVDDAAEVSFDLVLKMLEYGIAATNLTLQVFDPSFVASNPLCWSVKVTLDGVDISTDLIGTVRVEAEESLARTATFTMKPTGSIAVPDWVGKPVTVDFTQIDVNGNPVVTVRLFTGIVDIPRFDPTRVLVEFDCIDNLNGVLGQHTRPAIDQLIKGCWSKFIFDEDSDSLEYAQGQLSTVPKALDMDAYAQLRVTPWAAKVTPDFVLTAADQVLDDSVSFEMANRSDIKNCVNFDFSYRFPRLRARRVGIGWGMPRLDILIFQLINFTIPTKDMVESAVSGLDGGGWYILSANYYEPPVSQIFTGTPDVIWECKPEDAALLVWWVAVSLARKWYQTVTEIYRYKVKADASIADLGEICDDEAFGGEVDGAVFDFAGWEADRDREPAPQYLTIVEQAGPPWPRASAFTSFAIDTTAYGSDFLYDMVDVPGFDRAEQQNAVKTAQNLAKTRILGSHRLSRLVCTATLNPFVDLIHTVEVDSPHLSGKGKVASVVYDMDIDQGRATMTVDIAISGTGFVGAQIDDPLPAPPIPPVPTYTPPNSQSGQTLFGGDGASQFPQPNVESFPIGYLGNRTDRSGTFDAGKSYVPEFRLQAPAIPDELTQPIEIEVFGETGQGAPIQTEINVAIPQDDLTLTG